MKKSAISLLLSALALFTSCSPDNNPYSTVSEYDAPRILNTDINETTDGEPSSLPDVTRPDVFNFEVIVTPAEYTKVYWYINGELATWNDPETGELVDNGKIINKPLKAGTYSVKIVARTIHDKETYRNCTLVVKPAATDPTLADSPKNRWLQAGARAQIEGKNLEKVDKIILGNGKDMRNVAFEDGKLCFDVPSDTPLGETAITLWVGSEDFACGNVTVNDEPYPEPVGEEVLWEGNHHVTWDSPFSELKTKAKDFVANGKFAVGTRLRAVVSHDGVAEGDHKGAIASAWWTNLETGKSGDDCCDRQVEGDTTFDIVLTQQSLDLINEQDGMLVVGNGYILKKVSIVLEVPLWEGNHHVTWDTPFNALKEQAASLIADGTLAPSKVLTAYVKKDNEEGDHKGAIASAWWTNLETGKNGDDCCSNIIEGEMTMVVHITSSNLELITSQDGLLVVGNGYYVSKITICDF